MSDTVLLAFIASLPATIAATAALISSWHNRKDVKVAAEAATRANDAAVQANVVAVEAHATVQATAASAHIEREAQNVQLRVIHTLVNDLSTTALKTIMEQAERLFSITNLPADEAIAVEARKRYESKVATDARASAQVDAGLVEAANKTVADGR